MARHSSEIEAPGVDAVDATFAVRLVDVTKRFGTTVAVDAVSLDVVEGEFFSMLGPSGSGKTTTLRMIAGFEVPTSGTVELHGRDVTRLAPYERDVNTVFQDYALFPHMSVRENVEYGLKVKKVGRSEREERARDALGLVQLTSFEGRKPAELSGGQRQRVALARALVNEPAVLLLDEPLGALDLKLRQQMQIELKDIQQRVGLTFIYVTHDQEEALTMSDRLAVFNHGHIEQVGTPAEVYEHPDSAFVAGFVGTSNTLEPQVANVIAGVDAVITVRPEKIRLLAADAVAEEGQRTVTGHVRDVVYLGPVTRYTVELDPGGSLVVLRQNLDQSSMDALEVHGQAVRLAWAKENERRLHGDVPSNGGEAP